MIKFINPDKSTLEPTLFVRAILDHDGELEIQGDTEDTFESPTSLGWFTLSGGKLKFVYAQGLGDSDIASFVNLTGNRITCA